MTRTNTREKINVWTKRKERDVVWGLMATDGGKDKAYKDGCRNKIDCHTHTHKKKRKKRNNH